MNLIHPTVKQLLFQIFFMSGHFEELEDLTVVSLDRRLKIINQGKKY